MNSSVLLRVLFIFVASFSDAFADTPANCTYAEVRGKWKFSVGKGGHDRTLDCRRLGSVTRNVYVDLFYPDVAVDQYGNKGFWTLIYNQGFEVVVQGRKYFAFSKFSGSGQNVTIYCDKTMPGYSHNVLGKDWACFQGAKVSASTLPKAAAADEPKLEQSRFFRHNKDFINKINRVQTSWKATHYPEFEDRTLADMTRMAGGLKSRITGRPNPNPSSDAVRHQAATLPTVFDWRSMDGVNYVSPVRNQGSCGSCYAFSSLGMTEARIRIMSNNTDKTILSTQDIVECSEYSQGCEGGFPYLIGGKYAEDFGLVAESCNPYKGTEGACHTSTSCPRRYSTNYRYVGGYYGGCNEEQMKLALCNNGPLAVSFEVYNDFMHYRGGVYQHTGLQDKFNPFELTNHAVLLVGYGVDGPTGLPYWTIKNSWGEGWGENGYFRIRRGVDECAVESIAVESFPIF